MDETINQNIMSGVYTIIAVFICLFFIQSLNNQSVKEMLPHVYNENVGDNSELRTFEKPTIQVTGGYLELNQDFDPKDYVVLSYGNVSEATLKNHLKVYGTVDISKKGIYRITYVLTWNEIVERKESTFVVD